MLKDHGRIQKEVLEDRNWYVGSEKLSELHEQNSVVQQQIGHSQSEFAVGHVRSEFAVGHIHSEGLGHIRSGLVVVHSQIGELAVVHILSGVVVRIQSELTDHVKEPSHVQMTLEHYVRVG